MDTAARLPPPPLVASPLSDLVFLCSRCHKNVHEGLLRIIGCPEDNTLLFLDKHGRKLGVGTPLERAAWVDAWFGWIGDSETDSRALKLFLSEAGRGSADVAEPDDRESSEQETELATADHV